MLTELSGKVAFAVSIASVSLVCYGTGCDTFAKISYFFIRPSRSKGLLGTVTINYSAVTIDG